MLVAVVVGSMNRERRLRLALAVLVAAVLVLPNQTMAPPGHQVVVVVAVVALASLPMCRPMAALAALAL
jgi:hypothetical protein